MQMLDDHFASGHGDGPLGEVYRDDHRQHLGRDAHGNGRGKQKCLHPVTAQQAIDEEDQRNQHDDDPHHQ